MPAFVTNGPDIPESLLQIHEEGHVVFFCGAGISFPAGLPNFRGLVERIYGELGTTMTRIEEQAYTSRQYDATLDQLERRYPGQRIAVRTALATVLTPNWRRRGATGTHRALLQLATDRKGKVRLVTTNFDRIFHRVMARHKPKVPTFAAPLLPIPKPTRWHGVVHLHGELPEFPDEMALNRLILTSGDFGLAYLTERWAARFVSELFRNYTVCFVGYGINDPVLRYMMDALAADELLGEARPLAYAFADFHTGERDQSRITWEAKGVTPLLYEVPGGTHDHSALHRTLKEWADTYRDGVRGKQMLIAQHATTTPLAPSRADFAVGRVLWALTDGLAAKHFADLNPVPPLEWLKPLTEAQFGHEDLFRFGVTPKAERDDRLSFSVLLRPTPYTHAPRMCVFGIDHLGCAWDEVMLQLARWLARHLDDPRLIIWLANQGGRVHEHFSRLIGSRIEHLDRLLCDGKHDELDRIRADAPKAIPDSFMRTLWRLLLSGRLKARSHSLKLHDWFVHFKQDGLTPTLRIQLRELLTPQVTLRDALRWGEGVATSRKRGRIKDLVDCELALASDHVHPTLRDAENSAGWKEALPDLLPDLLVLLRDALDLMRELGNAEGRSDLSYMVQPSISKHPQNKGYHDWTALIDLTCDAWIATVKANPAKAKLIAAGWWQFPYPLFKRLVFFAATTGDVFEPQQALDWLLDDSHWWLWSLETQREAVRLLVTLAPKLEPQALVELEQAILQGPPPTMFKDDIEPEQWTRLVDHSVWLRLAKLQDSGAALGQLSRSRLDELRQRYPNWTLTPDERDEFPFWMEGGFGWRTAITSPPRRRELMDWLRYPSTYSWQEDDWGRRCRDNFPTAACALCGLAQEDQWPAERWREALQAWGEDRLLRRSWRYMARVVAHAPDEIVLALSHSLSWWLQVQAKTFEDQEELFFALIGRLLALEYEDVDQEDDPVFRAINHPIGHATDAVLEWWYRQGSKDSQGLQGAVTSLFTQLCDTKVKKFRHARVLLAAHVIALFRVDEQWATKHLLPLFDWDRAPAEARGAWTGFLWSPRLYRPLLMAIKQPLLETAKHYEQLGEHAEQYAGVLTFVALDLREAFSAKELAEATRALPTAGLERAAETLTRALEAAGEQRVDYWRNRALQYLKAVWPKSLDVMTPRISEALARLCIAAHEAFPEALKELQHWLQPIEHPDFVIHELHEAKVCNQFPSDAVTVLDAVIGDDVRWLPRELGKCLDDIRNADKGLADDLRFSRLIELFRRRGSQ